MQCHRLGNFKDGWWLGDFEPSVLKTAAFEVALKKHRAGDDWPRHYQRHATEYNLVVSGVLKVQGKTFSKDDIFVIEPFEAVKPEFVTDCVVVCVKVPSVPGDKVIDA